MPQPSPKPPTNSGPLRRNYDALEEDFTAPRLAPIAPSSDRRAFAIVMIGLGIVLGLVSFSLLTSTFGNNGSLGMLFAALAGSAIAMGVVSLRRRWTVVLGMGVLAFAVGPLLVVFCYWTWFLFVTLFFP